jgi:hypothetical protein
VIDWRKTDGQKSRDTVPLKGPWHEIFDLWYFHLTTPPRPPETRVKAFFNMAVQVTAESMTLLCRSQRSHGLRCDKNRVLQSRFSRRILIHIEKGFNPCLRVLGGVVWWKNRFPLSSIKGKVYLFKFRDESRNVFTVFYSVWLILFLDFLQPKISEKENGIFRDNT